MDKVLSKDHFFFPWANPLSKYDDTPCTHKYNESSIYSSTMRTVRTPYNVVLILSTIMTQFFYTPSRRTTINTVEKEPFTTL
jgi:hypothetical protein